VTPADLLTTPLRRDLVFDVGMHRGEDTAFYLRKGFTVVGFEADPDLVQHNRRRFAAEIGAGKLVVVAGAVADAGQESVAFYRHPTKTVWGTTDPDWAERNAHRGESLRVEVPVVDFGASISEHGVPWFMKIDIEGADKLCLRLLARFQTRPAYVSIESEKHDWEELEAEFDLLEQLGFDRFAVAQQEGLHRRAAQTFHTVDGAVFRHRFEEHASGPFGADVTGWGSREAAQRRYRRIFREYRLVGDRSRLHRTRVGFVALKGAARLSGRPMPGWYDTHAARALGP
jgi:FkbM family methyltransferase